MSEEMPIYQPTDRRAQNSDSAIIFLLRTVHDKVEAIQEELREHIRDETTMLAEEIAKQTNRAYPDGDPEGHREFHKSVIRKAAKSADFWEMMAREITKWGLIGFIGWSVVAIWKHFLEGPK